MTEITEEQYFAGYPDHPEITEEIRENARTMLAKVNAQIAVMEAAGYTFETNAHTTSPHFGTLISGMGKGGWRPQDCPEGAPRSNHKRGKAVDLCDHVSGIDAYCDSNGTAMRTAGLGREQTESTPNWSHWQDGPSGLGNWVFNPGTPARAV
jgi:hypothetical protein